MSATDPNAGELAGLQAPAHADPHGVLASATAPTAAELAGLRPRRSVHAAFPWRPVVSIGMLLMAFVVLPRGPGPVMLEQGVPTPVDDGIFLGRDIRSEGTGTLRLIQAGARGTIVELEAGQMRFDVNPAGLYTDLTVWADGARFVTQGASFTLTSAAELTVLSGSVTAFPEPQEEEGQRVLQDQDWHPPGLVPIQQVVQTLPAGEDIPLETPQAPVTPPRTPVQPALPPTPSEDEVQEQLDLEQADFEALLAARAGQRPKQTRTLAEDFLDQWEASPLRPEVEAIALSAAMADPTLDPIALLARVDRWLSENPKHPRFVEMHYLRATLLRDQLHDCEAAIVSYRVVVALGSGPQQAQAEHYLKACQQAR